MQTIPVTQTGQWAVRFCVAFLLLFLAWWAYVRATPIARPTFFSDPIHAVLIIAAAFAAVAGMVLGLISFLKDKEKSWLPGISILVGALVLYWSVAELVGH